MAKQLRPVTVDFLNHAPTRLVFTARLRSTPEAVFRELTDDVSTWPLWFHEVRSARYTGPPPYGVGAGRAVTLRGGVHFVESVLVRQEPSRFVYRVDQAGVLGARAWLEEWRLAPSEDGGTVLRFTLALDGEPALRAAVRLGRPGVARAFRKAFSRLDARCAES
jgi:uncharacterized protein YndB with AHSA1/START domain